MYRIEVVKSTKEVEIIAELAKEIWREYYPSIIGANMVEYMIKNYQSAEAIKQEIFEEGFRYYLANEDTTPVGYCGVYADTEHRVLKIHKLYIKKDFRGKGIFKMILNKIKSYAKELGLDDIIVGVNKNNQNAIDIYKHLGFKEYGEINVNIGDGFFMDDYQLKLNI